MDSISSTLQKRCNRSAMLLTSSKKSFAKHKSILFVGTKKQAKVVVSELAEAMRRILCLRTLAGRDA